MKVCFLAPSGYGKSTAIELLNKHYDIENIKIAEPLYELQKDFYYKLGFDAKGKQDGELLQFYGKKIRKEDKDYLLNVFKDKLNSSSKTIITNDDCRPSDFKFLKENGFVFIKINGFRRDRDDITIADSKNKIEWQTKIPYDYEINNYGSLEDYEADLIKLVNKILVPKCYVIPTQKMCNNDCVFCISKSRNYDKTSEFLEVNDKFVEKIYIMKKHEVTRFEITGGGEPFLNENLDKIIITIKKIIPDAYIKLYTNGDILKKINGINEIDISVVSDDLTINNKFMNGNSIELMNKIKFFKEENIKLRLSIPLIKGAIDSSSKLDNLVNKTKKYVDEYVVRTLYPNTNNYNNLYVDFNYENEKVIFERNNDVKDFNGLILWSDNELYNSWDLKNKKYFNSYLLLKPDSKQYINEIEGLIKDRGFKIDKRLLLCDFKKIVINLYKDKDTTYKKIINRHLEVLSYLFGDIGMVYILDKELSLDELYYETYKLKNEIREKYSFTHAYGGYVYKDENISHINLVHCPDISNVVYDKDLNYLLKSNVKEVDNEIMKKIMKYRSYDV